MKKILIVCCIVVLSLFSVGCTKVIDLSDEERYMVAEYAAELMLKYDRNFNLKYYDDTTEYVFTTTEQTKEEPDATGLDATSLDASPYSTDVTTNEQTALDKQDKSFDIAKYLGVDGVSLVYKDVLLTDTYPSYNHDGMAVEINAPEGYELLVLTFDLKNTSSADKEVDFYSLGTEYNIIVNGQKKAKQMFTILVDDLYTYQGVLEADSTKQVVLIFQISDTVSSDIRGLELSVDKGDDKKVIELQ